MTKVLLVEDDPSLVVALRRGFEFEGYAVAVAGDGEAALGMVQAESYDLMVLDVMLPKLSGLDVCQQLRGANNNLPVIMLTARGQEIDRVLGLRIGADDYLTKPFSFMELVARVEAVLRRTQRRTTAAEHYQFGDVNLDFVKLQAHKNGQPLALSQREFRLLKYFVAHRGEVVSRDQLLDEVWDYDHFPLSRTVDMHIAKLRQKIETVPSQPAWLLTVYGSGYKFIG